MSAVLDTHAVLLARTSIEDAIHRGEDVYVSAISLIEIVYLVERQRLPA